MITYKKQFKLGKNKDIDSFKINNDRFSIMKNIIIKEELEEGWKDNNLPNASIKIDNSLHVCIYLEGSRNMALLSRTNKIIIQMLEGAEITFYNFIKLTENQKIQMTLYRELGANFINFTKFDLFTKLPNELEGYISNRKNNSGIYVEGKELHLAKPNDKNWKFAALLLLYSQKTGKNWKIIFDKPTKEKDCSIVMSLIAKNIGVSTHMGEIKEHSKKYIKRLLNDNFFDSTINKTKQMEGILNSSRETNLYFMHNEILEKVALYYKNNGFKFTTEKLGMDLLAKKEENYIIAEIKSAPNRDAVLKSVGQLMFYRYRLIRDFGIKDDRIRMVFWSNQKPKNEMIDFLKFIGIEVEAIHA